MWRRGGTWSFVGSASIQPRSGDHTLHQACDASLPVSFARLCHTCGLASQPTLGSLGRPSTRSPTMLRWIWLVPPQMVSLRLKKNELIIGLTG